MVIEVHTSHSSEKAGVELNAHMKRHLLDTIHTVSNPIIMNGVTKYVMFIQNRPIPTNVSKYETGQFLAIAIGLYTRCRVTIPDIEGVDVKIYLDQKSRTEMQAACNILELAYNQPNSDYKLGVMIKYLKGLMA